MSVTFESLQLRPELLAACRKQGFHEATPIQALVIPAVRRGRDVVVEAKTGSGKTLAYGLPLLESEPKQTAFPEVLVIVPTRELAEQICAALGRAAGKLERRAVSLTGGSSMDRQRAELEEGATFAVGTLGRLQELLDRKLLNLGHVRTLVLDEVDELLRGGFSLELATLLKGLPQDRQTLLLSATIPNDVEQVARKFMRSPERLHLTTARELPAELSHRVMRTTVADRVRDMGEFLRVENPYQVLIFCGTRHESEELQDALVELGLEAEFLHGDLSPNKRRQVIEHFRSGELPVLVASDLAARGLDLPGVELVVNYSLPETPAAYLHRAGRTGRAGRPGAVVSMLIEQQQDRFEKLKQTLKFRLLEVKNGHVVLRDLKTREERDLEFRQLPPRPLPQGEAPREDRGPRGEASGEREAGRYRDRRPLPEAGRGDRRAAPAGGRGDRRPPPAAGRGDRREKPRGKSKSGGKRSGPAKGRGPSRRR
ncbi:MAG TPA: DEAD/DEAH box helicase [Myxococcales bacterium]